MKKKQVALGHGNYLGFSSILVKVLVQIPNKGYWKMGWLRLNNGPMFLPRHEQIGPLIARPIKLKHPIMARTCSRAWTMIRHMYALHHLPTGWLDPRRHPFLPWQTQSIKGITESHCLMRFYKCIDQNLQDNLTEPGQIRANVIRYFFFLYLKLNLRIELLSE